MTKFNKQAEYRERVKCFYCDHLTIVTAEMKDTLTVVHYIDVDCEKCGKTSAVSTIPHKEKKQ